MRGGSRSPSAISRSLVASCGVISRRNRSIASSSVILFRALASSVVTDAELPAPERCRSWRAMFAGLVAKTAAPAKANPQAAATVATIFSRVTNIILKTPCIKSITAAETPLFPGLRWRS